MKLAIKLSVAFIGTGSFGTIVFRASGRNAHGESVDVDFRFDGLPNEAVKGYSLGQIVDAEIPKALQFPADAI